MKTDGTKQASAADPSWRIGIVYSDFYKEEMAVMVRHAVDTLQEAGVAAGNISLYPVSGSFEIPLVGSVLSAKQQVDALIGLGIIVEGETHHARLVAENAARGMMDIQVRDGTPFANEVLYVDSLELAKARLHKGADAAKSAIDSLALLRSLQS